MIQVIANVKESALELFSKGYNYLLAVSSDTLYVISLDREDMIECIIEGTDNNGYVVQADDEDCFLEAIYTIKECIKAGNNPLIEVFGL